MAKKLEKVLHRKKKVANNNHKNTKIIPLAFRRKIKTLWDNILQHTNLAKCWSLTIASVDKNIKHSDYIHSAECSIYCYNQF